MYCNVFDNQHTSTWCDDFETCGQTENKKKTGQRKKIVCERTRVKCRALVVKCTAIISLLVRSRGRENKWENSSKPTMSSPAHLSS